MDRIIVAGLLMVGVVGCASLTGPRGAPSCDGYGRRPYAAGATLIGLAREYDLSRNLIRIWIAKYESGEFDPDIEAASLLADHEAKISTLERMVGRQALEIEFLKGALQQGRLPRSAPMSVIAGPAVSPSLKDAG